MRGNLHILINDANISGPVGVFQVIDCSSNSSQIFYEETVLGKIQQHEDSHQVCNHRALAMLILTVKFNKNQ